MSALTQTTYVVLQAGLGQVLVLMSKREALFSQILLAKASAMAASHDHVAVGVTKDRLI